jgi:hypothetical protein
VDNKYPPHNDNMFVWVIGLLIVICLICYLAYDILDALYDLSILGERMAQLEKRINDIAETNLLIWETKIVEPMHTSWNPFPNAIPPISKWNPLPAVLPPFSMLQSLAAGMLVLVLVGFPTITCWILWHTALTTHILAKQIFIIFDFALVIFLASMMIHIAGGLGIIRPEVRAMMKVKASEEWKPSAD